jgi:hypothetical protein
MRYIVTLEVDEKTLATHKESGENDMEAIIREFGWLEESGITFIEIRKEKE